MLYIVSFTLAIYGYLLPVYEYSGKGSDLPDIVSADAVIVILLFMVLSIFLASIVFLLKWKKAALCAFIVLIILDLHKIIQIILFYYIRLKTEFYRADS